MYLSPNKIYRDTGHLRHVSLCTCFVSNGDNHFFTAARFGLRTALLHSLFIFLLAGHGTMFSFRRKPKKEPESPRIRTSPSLPELNSQGIPWPEDLVDINAIRQEPLPEAVPSQGAAETSLQGSTPDVPIPFHKPFRLSTGKRYDGPISSLYMPSPCPTPDLKHFPRPVGRYSQRRARTPPTFNIMVRADLSYLSLPKADVSFLRV